MGYLYVYAESDEAGKTSLDTPEKLAEYAPIVNEFKKVVNKFEITRKTSEDAEVCGLSQDNLKTEYNIDSDGCADIQYKDFLTLLNSIRIESGSGMTVSTGSGKTSS